MDSKSFERVTESTQTQTMGIENRYINPYFAEEKAKFQKQMEAEAALRRQIRTLQEQNEAIVSFSFSSLSTIARGFV